VYPSSSLAQPGPPAYSGPPAYPGGIEPPTAAERDPRRAPYASWGNRLGGYLIDAVIFAVVLVVLLVLFRHTHALDVHLMARRGRNGRRRTFSTLPFLITGVLFVAYGTVLCGGPRGQTVGMSAVGVRAVTDQDRGALGYGRAFVRALVEGVFRLIELAFFLLGLIWIVDMLFPLWDKKRQTLHDKVVGSVVIRTRPPG
jgi:uncharacterized RDD family membrane protein YckC